MTSPLRHLALFLLLAVAALAADLKIGTGELPATKAAVRPNTFSRHGRSRFPFQRVKAGSSPHVLPATTFSRLIVAIVLVGGIAAPAAETANLKANAGARVVLDYFHQLSVRKEGRRILSGQFSDFVNRASLRSMEQIHEKTGHWPALIGVDYADFPRGSLTRKTPNGSQNPPGNYDYRRFIAGLEKDFPKTCFFMSWNAKWSLAANEHTKELLDHPLVANREDLPKELFGK